MNLQRAVKLFVSLGYYGFDTVRRLTERLLGRAPVGRCVVLYYHAIPGAQRERFARQMDDLLRWTTPIDAAGRTAAVSLRRRYAAVTFDDAFQSVAEHALPELRSRGIPFTVFAPSACLGSKPNWDMEPGCSDGGEIILTASELGDLPEDLATIGAHTRTHPHLPKLPAKELQCELEGARSELEQALGRTVTTLAFPYGEFDDRVLNMCRQAGYERVYGIFPGTTRFDSAEYCTPRVATDPNDLRIEFRLKLLGAYSWVPWASATKRWLLSRILRIAAD